MLCWSRKELSQKYVFENNIQSCSVCDLWISWVLFPIGSIWNWNVQDPLQRLQPRSPPLLRLFYVLYFIFAIKLECTSSLHLLNVNQYSKYCTCLQHRRGSGNFSSKSKIDVFSALKLLEEVIEEPVNVVNREERDLAINIRVRESQRM